MSKSVEQILSIYIIYIYVCVLYIHLASPENEVLLASDWVLLVILDVKMRLWIIAS